MGEKEKEDNTLVILVNAHFKVAAPDFLLEKKILEAMILPFSYGKFLE